MTPQAEIETLRERLFEAEEICRALRSGEVDAVVVGGLEDNKQVLLMSGSYARYRQIVDDMAQGAVTITGAGDILFANTAFATLLEQPLGDLFRTPLADYLDESHHDRLEGLLRGRERESVLRLADVGHSARVSLVSVSDDFKTLLFTPLDSEEAEEAEETLEAIRRGAVDGFVVDGERVVLLEHTPYRALVEHMHDGAIVIEEDGRISYANEGFVAAVATPHGNVVGRPLEQFISPSDEPSLRRLLEAREAAHTDLTLFRANGEGVAVHITMTRLDGQRLLLFRDTSLQKRHQAADERNRKFLGMLAHEFRNILGPIAYAVAYLKKTDGLSDETRKSVDVIERQTGRLTSLVEDLRRINPRE